MENTAASSDTMGFNSLVAFATFVHMGHVILFTDNFIILCIVGSFNDLATNTAILLYVLEVLLTDWFIFVEKV